MNTAAASTLLSTTEFNIHKRGRIRESVPPNLRIPLSYSNPSTRPWQQHCYLYKRAFVHRPGAHRFRNKSASRNLGGPAATLFFVFTRVDR